MKSNPDKFKSAFTEIELMLKMYGSKAFVIKRNRKDKLIFSATLESENGTATAHGATALSAVQKIAATKRVERESREAARKKEWKLMYDFEVAAINALSNGFPKKLLEDRVGTVKWGNQREECVAIKNRMRRGK